MIIVLKPGTTKEQAEELLGRIESEGLKSLYMPGSERTVLGAIGDERVLANFESHPLVESVKPILAPYKLVSRELHPHDTVVQIGSLSIGGDRFAVIAGPCSIESREQMLETAKGVKAAGAGALRGGAFKPRTSPYAFQGLGVEGLAILRDVAREVGLPTVTEVVEVADVEAVVEHADALQIGARNMQNFRLLKAVGECKKPVVLKRGMAATISDLLLDTLDLNAVPYIKQKSHLPVIVDPSHGTGVRDLVAPMARASAAVGADGIIVEVHHNPVEAWSDGEQSLFVDQFDVLMRGLVRFAEAAGKRL
jgi:3-deoxy-7-phosphoheptulonate synthase